MLWLCAIVSLPSLVLSFLAQGVEPLATALICIGSAPVVVTIIGFLYLMVVAPEKLQSEEYQLRTDRSGPSSPA